MGTRNLTMVIDQTGIKKVAQYGQWDGYPEGVGVEILNFLQSDLFEKFKSNLHKCRFLDSEGRDKEFAEDYDKNAPQWSNEPDNRTDEQKKWFDTYCHRDLAADVLPNIANSEDDEIILLDGEESGGLEWTYTINLQDNTLKVEGYSNKSFNLNELPTQEDFIKAFEQKEEEA